MIVSICKMLAKFFKKHYNILIVLELNGIGLEFFFKPHERDRYPP